MPQLAMHHTVLSGGLTSFVGLRSTEKTRLLCFLINYAAFSNDIDMALGFASSYHRQDFLSRGFVSLQVIKLVNVNSALFSSSIHLTYVMATTNVTVLTTEEREQILRREMRGITPESTDTEEEYEREIEEMQEFEPDPEEMKREYGNARPMPRDTLPRISHMSRDWRADGTNNDHLWKSYRENCAGGYRQGAEMVRLKRLRIRERKGMAKIGAAAKLKDYTRVRRICHRFQIILTDREKGILKLMRQ